MRLVRIKILLLMLVSTSGCSTLSKETTAANFRERAKIEYNGFTFFSGERKDRSKLCFPPSEKPICDEKDSKNSYISKSKLNIEGYTITLSDRKTYLSNETKEFAYLVAAELALQRGFEKLIVDRIYYSGGCRKSYSTSTSGTVSGSVYSGSTVLNEHNICVGLISIDVLIFNDYETIRAGVFYNHPYSKDLIPYPPLYFSSSDRYALLNRDQEYWAKTRASPLEAWRTYLSADETAVALREKYGVKPFLEYKINQPLEHKPSTLESLKRTD